MRSDRVAHEARIRYREHGHLAEAASDAPKGYGDEILARIGGRSARRPGVAREV